MPDDFAAAVAGRPGWTATDTSARYDGGNGWTALVTAVWNPGGRRLGWVWHVAWLEHGTARHTKIARSVQQAIKTAEQIDRKS